MKPFEILCASSEDRLELCEIFLSHIGRHREYISHGEIQMGVGVGRFEDGSFVTDLSPRAKEQWLKYIDGNLADPQRASVRKAVVDGAIAGFCVAEIMEDGADDFGMLCDLLVKEEFRGCGIGSALLNSALEWFCGKGVSDIYLESGQNNTSAHEYFIRKGFRKISEIYKLV